jgi:hypothetical protein
MVKILLGLDAIPKPHDATDALAVAICHLHSGSLMQKAGARVASPKSQAPSPKSWRHYRP